MNIITISKMPTDVEPDVFVENGRLRIDAPRAVHESCTRAYHILAQVKHYLKNDVPQHIILELISDMEYRWNNPGDMKDDV